MAEWVLASVRSLWTDPSWQHNLTSTQAFIAAYMPVSLGPNNTVEVGPDTPETFQFGSEASHAQMWLFLACTKPHVLVCIFVYVAPVRHDAVALLSQPALASDSCFQLYQHRQATCDRCLEKFCLILQPPHFNSLMMS